MSSKYLIVNSVPIYVLILYCCFAKLFMLDQASYCLLRIWVLYIYSAVISGKTTN